MMADGHVSSELISDEFNMNYIDTNIDNFLLNIIEKRKTSKLCCDLESLCSEGSNFKRETKLWNLLKDLELTNRIAKRTYRNREVFRLLPTDTTTEHHHGNYTNDIELEDLNTSNNELFAEFLDFKKYICDCLAEMRQQISELKTTSTNENNKLFKRITRIKRCYNFTFKRGDNIFKTRKP